MTVISGYLGAGKTTLINRILSEDHGLRLLVLVNDFGAINIDADLLVSSDNDTIALSNGCVCCTMGSDLLLTLGDVLDRPPWPDHLIIEASGVAEPAKIANAAHAEPDLRPAGIVGVVDAVAFETFANDSLIGPQVRTQIAQSDLLVLSKAEDLTGSLKSCLAQLTRAPLVAFNEPGRLSDLVLGIAEREAAIADIGGAHPAYASWSYEGVAAAGRAALASWLAARPAGLLRAKGVARDGQDAWLFHLAGGQVSMTERAAVPLTKVVAIGLGDAKSTAEIERWWNELWSTPSTTPSETCHPSG